MDWNEEVQRTGVMSDVSPLGTWLRTMNRSKENNNLKSLEKTCHTTSLPTTNPTWTSMKINLGWRIEQPETKNTELKLDKEHSYMVVFCVCSVE